MQHVGGNEQRMLVYDHCWVRAIPMHYALYAVSDRRPQFAASPCNVAFSPCGQRWPSTAAVRTLHNSRTEAYQVHQLTPMGPTRRCLYALSTVAPSAINCQQSSSIVYRLHTSAVGPSPPGASC